MGRNKQRTKAVDVTKSLLQPTSVTDHIAVQVGLNSIIQVAEDDLSPTQGSEAAFALRREGKLDTTMKLCLNWRQGNCHNHAACSFAHVVRYFGVVGELPSPVTTGRAAVFGGSGVASGTYSSVAAGGSGARGASATAATATAGAASSTPWSEKLAPPSYTPSNRTTTAAAAPQTPARAEEGKPAAAAATAVAEPKASGVLSPDTPALPTRTTSAATTTARTTDQAKEGTSAPPTPASTAADTPVTRPAVAPVPPAVVSVEGLRTLLLSLSTTAPTAPLAATTTAAAAAAAATSDAEEESHSSDHCPLEFLAAVEAAAEQLPPPSWDRQPQHLQQSTASSSSSSSSYNGVIDQVGKLIMGGRFSVDMNPAEFLSYALDMAAAVAAQRREAAVARGQRAGDVARSLGLPYPLPPTPGRVFSTAPATVASATSGLRSLGGAGGSFTGAGVTHTGGADDGELPVPGMSIQHLMNQFSPEE